MQKKWKIIFIVVSILIAIGAAIGIYFAVREKNAYTKEQQKFIDEIINSNKPNNPPVDIGGGTLPGGVVGEDETGNVVIVDGGESANEIWQKDPTDPNGGYDKVETPTQDDEGQPFTYQTVVQVSGNFALVQNDVGNHAVINLAETKVVLNYTDLQDAENLILVQNMMIYLSPIEDSSASEYDTIVLHTINFINLYVAKDETNEIVYSKQYAIEDAMYKVEVYNEEYIVVKGLNKDVLLKISEESVQEIKEYSTGYVKLQDLNLENYFLDLPEYLFYYNEKLCLFVNVNTFNYIFNDKLFISSASYKQNSSFNHEEYYFCYADKDFYATYSQSIFDMTKQEFQTWISDGKLWVAQPYYNSKYALFITYDATYDNASGANVVNKETAQKVYVDVNYTIMFAFNIKYGYLLNYDKTQDCFICGNANSVYFLDKYGNEVQTTAFANSGYYNSEDGCYFAQKGNTSGGAYALFSYSGQRLTDFKYYDLFGWFDNYAIGTYIEITGPNEEDVYTHYERIYTNGTSEVIEDFEETLSTIDVLKAGVYFTSTASGKINLHKFDGTTITENIQNVVCTNNGANIYICYTKEEKTYTLKFQYVEAAYMLGNNTLTSGSFLRNQKGLFFIDSKLNEPGEYNGKTYTRGFVATNLFSGTRLNYENNYFSIDFTSVEIGAYMKGSPIIQSKQGWFLDMVCAGSYSNGAHIQELMSPSDSGSLTVRPWEKFPDTTYNMFGMNYNYETANNEIRFDDDVGTGGASRFITDNYNIKLQNGEVYHYVNYFGVTGLRYGDVNNVYRKILPSDAAHAGEGLTEYITYLENNGYGLEDKFSSGWFTAEIEHRFSVNVPHRTGYIFKGYYFGEEQVFNENGELSGGYSITRRGTITLKAKWESIKTSVVFKFDDENSIPITYAYDEIITKAEVNKITEPGYDFVGWFTNINDKEYQVFNGNNEPVQCKLENGKYILYRPLFGSTYSWKYYNANGEESTLTLYRRYKPKSMNVQVSVDGDKNVEKGKLEYAILGNDFGSATSKTYTYNETDPTNCIKIKMSEALGYYISYFTVTWLTYNNDNILVTFGTGKSPEKFNFEGIVDPDDFQNGTTIEVTNGPQTVVAIPSKTVEGSDAVYTFDFKNGTGTDSKYLCTYAIQLTVYIGIDLSVSPKHLVQTHAPVTTQMPVILPQNKKEEA